MTDEVVELTPEQQDEQAKAAFDAQFTDKPVEPPKVEPAPEPKAVETETKPEEKPEPAPDPWAGVPEVVRKQFADLSARNQQLEREIKTVNGRTAALQSAIDSAKAAQARGESAPTQSQIKDAFAAGGEKWRKLMEELPEGWADGFEERLSQIAPPKVDEEALQQRVSERVAESLAPTLTQRSAERDEEILKKARAMAVVDVRHPDWEVTINEPAFLNWARLQPPEIQALADSSNARDAVRMLDLYGEYRKKAEKQAKQSERLQAAVPVKSANLGGPSAITSDREAAEEAFAAQFR